MLVLLKFFCQIISVDVKSLVTSFNIPELHFKLLGFNILGMNYGLVLDKSLVSRGFVPPIWLLQLLGPKFFMNGLLVKYDFLPVHLKLLDVSLQILAIHQLRLKLHPLLIGAPSAFYHPILLKKCMLNSAR